MFFIYKLLRDSAILVSSIFFIIANTTSAASATGKLVDIDASVSRIQQMAIDPGIPAHESSMLVSAAAIDRTHIALVDYSNLSCLNIKNSSVKVIPKPHTLTGPWVPTGIVYHSNSKTLYIANYLGNNIIAGKLDCAKGTFKLTDVIESPNSVSPENVAITEDGRTLVSANYDGNSVTAFQLQTNGWKPLWSATVPLAHGIAIIGSRVYATGLLNRNISMIDLHSGQILKQAGQLGTDATQTGLMWPTGLVNFNGSLLLSDAHTGYVCSINLDTLSAEACFGGNGFGTEKFNMPYGVAQRGKNLLILSAYSSRVAEAAVDLASGKVQIVQDWYWTGNMKLNRDFTMQQRHGSTRTVAFLNNPYSSVCLMPTWLPGMACAYAGLTNKRHKFLRFPTENSILQPSGYFYFLRSFPGRSAEDTYFFSPQNSMVINVRLKDGVPFMLTGTYKTGMQEIDDRLVSATQNIAKETIRDDFDRAFAALEAKRNKAGVIPLTDASSLAQTGQAVQFQTRLQSSITASKSAAGDKLLKDYMACSTEECDGDLLREDALQFASEQIQAQDILLDRVIIPCMLTNAKCEPLLWNALTTTTE